MLEAVGIAAILFVTFGLGFLTGVSWTGDEIGRKIKRELIAGTIDTSVAERLANLQK